MPTQGRFATLDPNDASIGRGCGVTDNLLRFDTQMERQYYKLWFDAEAKLQSVRRQLFWEKETVDCYLREINGLSTLRGAARNFLWQLVKYPVALWKTLRNR